MSIRSIIKKKLISLLEDNWDKKIEYKLFYNLTEKEMEEIKSLYNLDKSLSKLQVYKKLSEILEDKKLLYKTPRKQGVSDVLRNKININQEGKTYSFDVETLYKDVFINDKYKNPYTDIPFDEYSLYKIEEEYENLKNAY